MDELDKQFDPEKYYSSYPCRVILRPGYPARAQYKSTLLWKLYAKKMLNSMDKIDSYADIGGCFGFGANSMAFHISQHQGYYPETKVFEISDDFITIGKKLFPYIDFINDDFSSWKGSPEIFDLISMFDVIEHISDPLSFLSSAANHFKFALLDTPLETSGEWFGGKPPNKQGSEHEDGHINFFTPSAYQQILASSGFELIDGKIIHGIVPPFARDVLVPESMLNARTRDYPTIKRLGRIVINNDIFPVYLRRKIFGGGNHIGLFRSSKFK